MGRWEKYKERKIKKAYKRQNRSKRYKLIKHLLWATAIITPLAILSKETYEIYKNYQKTLEWGHNQETDIKMAELDPAIFSDPNEDSVRAKKEFIKLKNTMVKDGLLTDTATQENIEILNEYINQMTSDQEKYKNEIKPIEDRINIQKEWDSIFTNNNHTQIKENITPQDIIIIINNTYPFLKEEMIKSYHQDPFSKKILEEQESVISDFTELNRLTEYYKLFIINKTNTDLILPGNMYPKDFEPIKINTTYEWIRNQTLNKINPLIEDQFNKNLKDLEKYNAYKNDLQEKDTAYANYNNERDNAISNIKYQIWTREQEKLEKERKEKEKAQKLKEEQERKEFEEKQKEEQKNKEETISNNNENNNNNIIIPDLYSYTIQELYNWSETEQINIILQPVIDNEHPENTILEVTSNGIVLSANDKISKEDTITIKYTVNQ